MNSSPQFDPLQLLRDEMVRSQLRGRGICDARVLDAMRSVPRHEFVPASLVVHAYDDRPLPIGLGQTISQPYIVAAMLEHLSLQPEDRVLEIGTGSGYVTALLSLLSAEIFSIELKSQLAGAAETTLHRLGYSRINIRIGDGTLGWPERQPFDAILISAATREIPPLLIQQLREGGRMIVPVGSSAEQALQLIEKVNCLLKVKILEGCRFVPLVAGSVE